MDKKLYGDSYLRLTAVLLSNKYKQIKFKWLKLFRDLGCPISSEEFITAKEYDNWIYDLHETVKKKNITISERNPVDEIIKSFKLNAKQKSVRERVYNAFYFGQIDRPVNRANLAIKDNQIVVTVPAWVRREDWDRLWSYVQPIKLQINGKKSVTHKYQTFERDFHFYEMYKKAKELKATRKNKTSILEILREMPEFKRAYQDYDSKVLESQLLVWYKNIPTRFNKLLNGIDFSITTESKHR